MKKISILSILLVALFCLTNCDPNSPEKFDDLSGVWKISSLEVNEIGILDSPLLNDGDMSCIRDAKMLFDTDSVEILLCDEGTKVAYQSKKGNCIFKSHDPEFADTISVAATIVDDVLSIENMKMPDMEIPIPGIGGDELLLTVRFTKQ